LHDGLGFVPTIGHIDSTEVSKDTFHP